MQMRSIVAGSVLYAAALLSFCSPHRAPALTRGDELAPVERSEGLVLQPEEGERRVRRPRPGSSAAQTSPFILKVDARNGGSPDLVMGYEEIAPGETIQPHRHLVADEIVYVHRGSGSASLGGRESAVGEGATLYIPRNTVISLRNTGSEPLGVAFVFSRPGFEQLMRENSVPEGEPATPLPTVEQARIRERHRWHTIAGSESAGTGTGGLILEAASGERRVRRPGVASAAPHLTAPFILKVDRRNGGSPDLVMGFDEIAPGEAIPPHWHPLANEIIFVRRGSGIVNLGTRDAAVGSGATIYVPRETRIALRNAGPEPLEIVFFFSGPGVEGLMRETSVAEGQPATPLSEAELSLIRERHRRHIIFERP